MKALILAAGFGTRLLPWTGTVPKPLFTLLNKPVLEHAIEKLTHAGCEKIYINTHHLHEKIERFIEKSRYKKIVSLVHEPVILDTGGAIANLEACLKDAPFFVVNSDVFSDVDLNEVYRFHEKSACAATLVLHHYEKFNIIGVDADGYIQDFNSRRHPLAFTGIQVLSPEIFIYFPALENSSRSGCLQKNTPNVFSSIDVYQNICKKRRVKAFIAENHFWCDIGTKESYSKASMELLAAGQLKISSSRIRDMVLTKLAGDGSDRRWYRVSFHGQSVIIADHGICLEEDEKRAELDAFIHIGRHLARALDEKILPEIYDHDPLSGMAAVEDLGDTHLETLIENTKDKSVILRFYKKIADHLISFSQQGIADFNLDWTCQTCEYSRDLILEKECRYFVEEFIQGYLKKKNRFEQLQDEFEFIARQAVANGFSGLMHRDMQSRNIMISKGRIYFIDFQSARKGPLQYDLASLLIDPYVCLDSDIKETILSYTMDRLMLDPSRKKAFQRGFDYCCLTRNLQILGAFAFLSQKKNKKKFETFIPAAVKSLQKTVDKISRDAVIPELSQLVKEISTA